jgi:hypothetical protein
LTLRGIVISDVSPFTEQAHYSMEFSDQFRPVFRSPDFPPLHAIK